MHKIKATAPRRTIKKLLSGRYHDIVPPDMRHLHVVGELASPHRPVPPGPGHPVTLHSSGKEAACPDKSPAAESHCLICSTSGTRNPLASMRRTASPNAPTPGSTTLLRAGYHPWIIRNDGIMSHFGKAPSHIAQIPHPVVHDRDHNTPFVDGTVSCVVSLTAWRRARPNDLKIASA